MRVGELAVRALLGGVALDIDGLINEVPSNSTSLLAARQSCDIGYTPCGTGCMRIGRVCCPTRDASCDAGTYCMASSGCCPNGRTCSGVGTCDPGEKRCNTGCIPDDGVCCPGSGYCKAGYVCTTNNKCAPASGGGGGGGGSGGGNPTCDAGKAICDADYCMPSGSSGYACTANDKCCPVGQTCSGSGGGSGGGGGGGGLTTRSPTVSIPSPTIAPPPRPTTDDDDTVPSPTEEPTTTRRSTTTTRSDALTASLPTFPATTPSPTFSVGSANGLSVSIKGCILAVGGAALALMI